MSPSLLNPALFQSKYTNLFSYIIRYLNMGCWSLGGMSGEVVCVKGLTVEERFGFVCRKRENRLGVKQKMSIETGIVKEWNRLEIGSKSIENIIDRWRRFNLRCTCAGPLELNRGGVAGGLGGLSAGTSVGTGFRIGIQATLTGWRRVGFRDRTGPDKDRSDGWFCPGGRVNQPEPVCALEKRR